MKETFFKAESEKANCSAIVHAVMDDFGLTLKHATISIPKEFNGHENILKALKKNGFDIPELLIDIETQLENEET